MARKDAKMGLIQSVPLFSHCAKRELEAIASTADLIEVPAGMELVRQGGHSNELVIIAEGAVDVTQDGASIRSLGSGDFFGEVALVTGGTRTASVTTTTAVHPPRAHRQGVLAPRRADAVDPDERAQDARRPAGSRDRLTRSRRVSGPRAVPLREAG